MRRELYIIAIIIILSLTGCNRGITSSNKEINTTDQIMVASSQKIFEGTYAEIMMRDFNSLGKYMESGDVYVVDKDIKVRIILEKEKYAKILIMEGKHANKEAWTAKEFLGEQ